MLCHVQNFAMTSTVSGAAGGGGQGPGRPKMAKSPSINNIHSKHTRSIPGPPGLPNNSLIHQVSLLLRCLVPNVILSLGLLHVTFLHVCVSHSQRLVPDTGVEALSVLSSRLDPELPQPPHATLHEAFFFSYSSHNPQGGMHTGWPIWCPSWGFPPKAMQGHSPGIG